MLSTEGSQVPSALSEELHLLSNHTEMWEAVCGNLKHSCCIVVGNIGNGIKVMKPGCFLPSNLLPPGTEQ